MREYIQVKDLKIGDEIVWKNKHLNYERQNVISAISSRFTRSGNACKKITLDHWIDIHRYSDQYIARIKFDPWAESTYKYWR